MTPSEIRRLAVEAENMRAMTQQEFLAIYGPGMQAMTEQQLAEYHGRWIANSQAAKDYNERMARLSAREGK